MPAEAIVQHTPGEWHVEADSELRGVYNLTFGSRHRLPADREDEANRRLIAAAPDLLAACESALAFLDQQRDEHNAILTPLPHPAYTRGPVALKVVAAIAKARGAA